MKFLIALNSGVMRIAPSLGATLLTHRFMTSTWGTIAADSCATSLCLALVSDSSLSTVVSFGFIIKRSSSVGVALPRPLDIRRLELDDCCDLK
jgi:hypothetical protein